MLETHGPDLQASTSHAVGVSLNSIQEINTTSHSSDFMGEGSKSKPSEFEEDFHSAKPNSHIVIREANNSVLRVQNQFDMLMDAEDLTGEESINPDSSLNNIEIGANMLTTSQISTVHLMSQY